MAFAYAKHLGGCVEVVGGGSGVMWYIDGAGVIVLLLPCQLSDHGPWRVCCSCPTVYNTIE